MAQETVVDDVAATGWDDDLLFEVAVDPFKKIAISGREEGRVAGLREGYLEGVNIGRSKGWEIGLELGYIHDFSQGILHGYHQRTRDKQLQPQTSPIAQTQSEQNCDGNDAQQSKHRMSHRLMRCLTLARDLEKLINEFPDPDELLSQDNGDNLNALEKTESSVDGCISTQCQGKSSDGGCCNTSPALDAPNCHKNNEEGGNSDATNQTGKVNVSTKIQSDAMLDVSAPLERIRAKFKLLCVLLKTKQQFDLKSILDLGIGSDNSGVEVEERKDINRLDNDQSIVPGLANDVPLPDTTEEKKHQRRGVDDISYPQVKDSSGLGSDW